MRIYPSYGEKNMKLLINFKPIEVNIPKFETLDALKKYVKENFNMSLEGFYKRYGFFNDTNSSTEIETIHEIKEGNGQ